MHRRKSDYQADFRLRLPDGTIKYHRAVGYPILNETAIPGYPHDELGCFDPVFLRWIQDGLAGRTPPR
jgi:hypothetical protein